MTPYTVLILLVVAERFAELAVARRNGAWSRARGGREYGRGHYPVMVGLHTLFLLGCLVEPWAADRPFLPWLGLPALALALAAQALRWWCIAALGPRWHTRVLIVPGLALISSGPYRYLRHPNYVAVVVEGVALPLVHTAWLTALAFTVLNAVLLTVRIRCESAALAPSRALPGPGAAS
ncbi:MULTISPECIES: isoprenylcysteine carboxyl methyltransferase family protein [unclassified Streptomyces]|uniref:isoprenylcysteine carboxyl methyltransferase family protein n=1 Tax=unclassified Streptomyces TaxID=2593676 RepID=UPI00340554EA